MSYSVLEVISGQIIGDDLPLHAAYAMRDEWQDAALERGRDLAEERYGIRCN